MGILRTLGGWATDAFKAIFGAASDIESVLQKFWSFITTLRSLLSWVVANPVLALLEAVRGWIIIANGVIGEIRDALHRIGPWTWATQVLPVLRLLEGRIASLRAWAIVQLHNTALHIELRYREAVAWTNLQVGNERNARIAAVKSEHAAMLAQIRALHSTIEKEAVSGYDTGTPDRKTVLQQLLTDLAGRDPAVKGLVSDLLKLVIDVDTIDNPLLRYAATKLLSQIIAHLGIDQAISDLIGRLLGPLMGDQRPAGLYDVEKDVAARLSALEAQWAAFMANGGPEVEQAGKGWKDGGSLIVDVAILAFAGLAYTDPSAWATGVNDTIGAGANAAMTGIVDLISKA